MPTNKVLVSVDANTAIHFHRSGLKEEPGLVLEGIVDEFVYGEIKRRAPEVFTGISTQKEMRWMRIIRPEELTNSQKEIYKTEYNITRLLFDPQDWGEARAIALDLAIGAKVLLTDDTKKSGPRDYILKGAIEAIGVISFWEVLLMLRLTGTFSNHSFQEAFDNIKQLGYTTPPRLDFNDAVPKSIQRLKTERWFQEWRFENGIHDGLLSEIETLFQ